MVGDIFDIHSVYHFIGFAFLFYLITLITKGKLSWTVNIIIMLSLAFGWEVAEHFLQRAFPALWSNMIEHWMNAWVTDILCDLGGGTLSVWAMKKWKPEGSKE